MSIHDDEVYVLKLTGKQLDIISHACESLCRIGLGQIDSVIMSEWRWRGIEPYGDDSVVEDASDLLDRAKEILTGLPRSASLGIYSVSLDEKYKVAWDIYKQISYRRSWDRNPEGGMGVNYHRPLLSSNHPFLHLTRTDQHGKEITTDNLPGGDGNPMRISDPVA